MNETPFTPQASFTAFIPVGQAGHINVSTPTIDELLATLGKLGITPAGQPTKTAPPDPAPKPKAEMSAKEKQKIVEDIQLVPEAQPSAPAAAEPSAAKTQADASPTKADGADPLDYAVLQKAVFELAGKSRDAAAEINGKFGVKTMKDLPADRRREALAAVQAKLAELQTEPA